MTITTISSSDISLEGNILFDEGAQRSFISQEMATKLNLQPNNKDSISLASFVSNAAAHRKLPIAVVQVHTTAGDKIPISVLIVPKIGPPVRICHAHHFNKYVPHLNGLHLTHPITEGENFQISVLIDADYYWSFVQDHIVHGDGPTAVQYKLGYLLSGSLSTSLKGSTARLLQVSVLCCTEVPNTEKIWNVEVAGITQLRAPTNSF